MFGEWRERDCHIKLRDINHMGKEAKGDPSKDFWTVNGTRTGHKA